MRVGAVRAAGSRRITSIIVRLPRSTIAISDVPAASLARTAGAAGVVRPGPFIPSGVTSTADSSPGATAIAIISVHCCRDGDGYY
eukprot:8768020-Pyramimonas_sp.AAC.1